MGAKVLADGKTKFTILITKPAGCPVVTATEKPSTPAKAATSKES